MAGAQHGEAPPVTAPAGPLETIDSPARSRPAPAAARPGRTAPPPRASSSAAPATACSRRPGSRPSRARAPSSRRTAPPPRISPKNCCQTSRGTKTSTPTAETARTTYAAGSSRRIRRAQNCGRLTDPVRSTSRRMCEVIRKPLITKKTSTPMYPPGTGGATGGRAPPGARLRPAAPGSPDAPPEATNAGHQVRTSRIPGPRTPDFGRPSTLDVCPNRAVPATCSTLMTCVAATSGRRGRRTR